MLVLDPVFTAMLLTIIQGTDTGERLKWNQVLVPINQGNTHWLLGVLDFVECRVTVYNSGAALDNMKTAKKWANVSAISCPFPHGLTIVL